MPAAAAFTVGSDIFLGPRSKSPSVNRRLLAHELAHVVQQRRPGTAAPQASPEPPRTAGAHPTLAQVLTPGGEAFRPEYADLQHRYERYRQGRTNPAPPERWVKLARDANRAALMSVLGPNLGDPVEPANPDEVDVLRISELQRPTGYTDEQVRQDLELLQRYPGALDARLTSIPQDQLQRGEFAGGYVRIAAGNVGEALAEPVLQQRLQELRIQYPDAQIFRNVRIRMPAGTNADGSVMLGPPLLFSDGIIGRFTGSGFPGFGLQLQRLYVQEVKSGAHGGQEGTEQIFRWIEANIDEGSRLVLEDGRELEYDPTAPGGGQGVDVGSTGDRRRPRGRTAGGWRLDGHRRTGRAGRIETIARRDEVPRRPPPPVAVGARTAAAVGAEPAHGLRAEVDSRPHRPRRRKADPRRARRPRHLVRPTPTATEHRRCALYQRAPSGVPGVRVSAWNAHAGHGPSASSGSTSTTAARARHPDAGGTPSTPPTLVPTTPGVPRLPAGAPALPALSPASAIGAGAVPATGLGMWMPRVSGIGNAHWIIVDGFVRDAAGRPVTGYQDGEIWIRVIRPGGTPLPPVDPGTGSPAPIRQVLTREGPVRLQPTPYETRHPGRPQQACGPPPARWPSSW